MLWKYAITLKELEEINRKLLREYRPSIYPSKYYGAADAAAGFAFASLREIEPLPRAPKSPWIIFIDKGPPERMAPFLYHELHELKYFPKILSIYGKRRQLRKFMQSYNPAFFDVSRPIPEHIKKLENVLMDVIEEADKVYTLHAHPVIPILDWNVFASMPKQEQKLIMELDKEIGRLLAKKTEIYELSALTGLPLSHFMERGEKIPKPLRKRLNRFARMYFRASPEERSAIQRLMYDDPMRRKYLDKAWGIIEDAVQAAEEIKAPEKPPRRSFNKFLIGGMLGLGAYYLLKKMLQKKDGR